MKDDLEFGRTYGWIHRWLQAPSVRILRKVQKSWARTLKILIQFLVEERENVGAAETHELNSTGFIYAEPEYCSHNYTELTLTSSSWTGLTSCFFFLNGTVTRKRLTEGFWTGSMRSDKNWSGLVFVSVTLTPGRGTKAFYFSKYATLQQAGK